MAENRRSFILDFLGNALLNQQTKQKRRKIKSPENECPVRTVPESRKEPDGQNVKKETELFDSVAAHGDIDIITEPASERHMPSAPEFGDGR